MLITIISDELIDYFFLRRWDDYNAVTESYEEKCSALV